MEEASRTMRDFNKLMEEASKTRKIIEETSEVREIIEKVRKVSEGLNNHLVPPIREILKEGQNVSKLLKELSNHYENIRRLLHHSDDFSVA
jgi:gamma-glutamyl:cysteine ligase YbdK (ATP-grasp superfamily)